MGKKLLAILLVFGMLAACTPAVSSQAAASPPVSETTAEAAAAPAEPTAEPVTEVAMGTEEAEPERTEGCNRLTIYWTAETIRVETSDVWLWHEGKDGRGYPFVPAAYGAKCIVDIPADVKTVGFIVRTDCSEPCGTSWGSATKDYDGDRFVEMDGDVSIYLKSGDGAIYYSEDGGVNLYQKKNFTFAGIVAENKIKYRVEPATNIDDIRKVRVYRDGAAVGIESLSSLNNTVVTGTITLTEPVDITALYEVEIEGFGRQTALPTDIFDCAWFRDTYVDLETPLGAEPSGGETTFRVWAPTASAVMLNLFEAGNDCEAYASVPMERGEKGVWSSTQPCGSGTYYTYSVTTAVGTQEAVDPYAKAVGVNGERGMVIDLDATDPAGFAADDFDAHLSSYRDAVIWEVHVRDFSNRAADAKYPGKYLAFTETGWKNANGISIGVDYLADLGVTHVHLQPIYDFATVDETHPEDQFNWGYDPKNYNAPEGSYSTDPYHGEVRVNELKQMVQALHRQGIGVVMDVVYNHTYDGNSNLNRIVPYYYYRYTTAGENSNGSGCGNETASNRLMFRRYMVDSVTYWQTEYHIDGFRFDLMGLHDIETMQAIETAVHAINPQALLYGEGWTGGTSTLNPNMQAIQANIHEVTSSGIGAIAAFNDSIRDGLKGSVFDAKAKGYISGEATALNANKVLFGVTGGNNKLGGSWIVNDALVINYMSSHDNRTLWDILKNANPDADDVTLLAQYRLGASLVILSKGTPFWLAGEEMLRTKQGNENSYNASDEINNLDWDALAPDSAAYAMSRFYRDLIALRKANPWLFHCTAEGAVLDQNAIAVTYTDETTKGFLAANPTGEPITVTLPEGAFEGIWNASGTVSETVEVPPMSVVVLKTK